MVRKPGPSEHWQRVETLFHQALDRPRADRQSYLEDMCSNEPLLLAEVGALLEAHAADGSFIEPPTVAIAAERRIENHQLPDSVGGFRIIRQVASGGMGTVYEAEQLEPRRTVALKVLRNLGPSTESLRRFRHECQILARLKHPGIAQIYAAGTAREGGRALPYFAMEYIPGAQAIDAYANDRRVSTRDRLNLFITACDAVQYGHQLGIIHRDLKPANILVGDSGRPKVIDFGVARVTAPDAAQTTLHTQTGQLIGTLTYMSPEQCDPHAQAIDTRSDVYALGIVLYKLLCDELPYDVRQQSLLEATRIIKHVPPRKPSLVDNALRGDLETIMLKALAKDPAERYQTVADLARDLRCFLNREPIQARPASMTYHLRMFARRNRTMVAAMAIAAATLVLGAAFSTLFAVRAMRAAHGESLHRAKAEQIKDFLQDVMISASPYRTGQNVTIMDLLEEASRRARLELRDQPEAEADVRYTIARTYAGLWMWDRVDHEVRQALELYRHHTETTPDKLAASLTLLGRACSFLNKPESRSLHLEAIGLLRREHGDVHPKIAEATGNLAFAHWDGSRRNEWTTADALYRQAIDLYDRSDSLLSRDAARNYYSYAAMLTARRRYDEAEKWLRRSLDIYRRLPPGTDSYMFEATNNLGRLLMERGKVAEAEALMREAVAMNPEGFKPLRVSDTYWKLAGLCHGRYEHTEANAFYRQALAAECRGRALHQPEQADELNAIADSLTSDVIADCVGRPYAQALGLLHHSGHQDVRWKVLAHNIADMLYYEDPAAAAQVSYYALTIEDTRPRAAALHADTMHILGASLSATGEWEEGEGLMLESYPVIECEHGSDSAYAADARQRLAAHYTRRGMPEMASDWIWD